MCNSIVELVEDLPFAAMPCDICCTEPNFCRDCCCILCCKTVKLNHRGYSYVKCEAIVSDGFICGHVAHIDCALRTYMAGTVGGTIGLDAEYYCRRCDARTDLVPHALRIMQTCKSIDSRGEIEKLLNVGISILRGSKKTEAIRTLRHVDLTLKKLKCGTSLEDIWKADEDFSAISSGTSANGNATLGITTHQNFVDNRMSLPYVLSKFTDFCSESLKLDDEIDHVLEALQIAQEAEYKLAEERLYAQKKYLQNLYQQLEKERTALACRTGKTSTNALLSAVLKGVKQEVVKLEQMKEVYKGFGRTSKAILKEHFGLEVED
ncbi:hypothetical protein K2173_008749 [Erythroxylum novogranatense]|uniref:Oberon PHD finger domain-containing protein n=1 Tax=Erythroxylum novogranatense TaxID=1862640 RepID=A0AAV8S5V3_9ROSI|nr:hypothetical protein K2173_008749 [Erythroxylum novogranatense]